MSDSYVMGLLGVALVLPALGCGGSQPPPSKSLGSPTLRSADVDVSAKNSRAPREVHERIMPHTCSTRAKISEMLGRSAPAPAPPPDEPGEASAPAPPTSAGGSGTLGADVYRSVAPATVLVRTPDGFGSGVVIDSKGYVLTNQHVVGDGLRKDLVVHVDVVFGDLTPTGRMAHQSKAYDGVVVKSDGVRDLALVRVMDPPPKLSSVKLAPSAPQIGEKVLSIGHAGIGFLWAAKSCHVAGVGEHQQDTSVLAALDCSAADASLTSDEAEKQKKVCNERKKALAERFASDTQGLAVQTDCAITHGDSGGPLVNASGELVGLNQSIAEDVTTASFHVHVDEIRDFTAKHGEEGIAMVPDPLCDAGPNLTLADIDLDGVPETLIMEAPWSFGAGRSGALIDLDQDHFTKPHGPLDPLDAELAILTAGQTTYVWYDVDNDSRFDVLLVDDKSDGKPEHAYRIDAQGAVKEDKTLVPQHDIDVSLVKDPSLHARLGKIATTIGRARFTSPEALASASHSDALPDPLLGAGTQGRLVDTDADGKPDTVLVRGPIARGVLIDVTERSIGDLKPGDSAEEALKAKKVEAQIAVVSQGNSAWAFYDTNADSKFDLVLVAENAPVDALYATRAWRLDAGGAMTPAPEQIGRNVLRPALVEGPRAVGALRSVGWAVAADEGAGSLPDPRGPRSTWAFREVKGFPKGTVITTASGSWGTTLIDLHAKAQLPKATEASAVARDPKFRPAIAVVSRGDAAWAYYDTDDDGLFDLVLFAKPSAKDPIQAFRLKRTLNAMTLEADSTAVSGRLIRNKSVLKDKASAAKLKAVESLAFKSSIIEE